jgi:hypothetical protein
VIDCPQDAPPESRVIGRETIELSPGSDLAALEDLGEDLVALQVQRAAIPEGSRAPER